MGRPPWDGLPVLMMADQKGKIMKMLYPLEKDNNNFLACEWEFKGSKKYQINDLPTFSVVSEFDTLEELESYAAENGFVLRNKSLMNICDIKPALEKLEALEATADAAEEEMMNNVMNDDKEKAFDEAYKAQYECFMNISCALVELSGGKITIADARAIVNGKRERLKEIF